MQVIGTIELVDEPVECAAVRVSRDGSCARVDDAVQEERLLDVFVNDIHTMKLACSASHLVELVVGRLFTEGIIESADEIDAVSVCEQAMRADVVLFDRRADTTRRAAPTVPTCCTNNVVLNDFFSHDLDLRPVEPIPWRPEQIFRICDEFELDKTAHSRTRGSHSAYLCTLDETLVLREDIGRHNAFDKAIGWALINGVDLSQCLLYTSGRVPTDMVVKAIRARMPILVSKSVATDKTVALAREFDLTLICEGKSGRFDVFNDPQGVVAARPAAARRTA